MKFARIDLAQTNYQLLEHWQLIHNLDIDLLNTIYHKYCRYKKFVSVMPIFDSQYRAADTDIVGYYTATGQLIAFSLIRRYDSQNAECLQFAWDYADPNLRLGIETIKHECALYKSRGYRYLYLGGADKYKQSLAGFEMLGPAA
jgi:hypothetical protein